MFLCNSGFISHTKYDTELKILQAQRLQMYNVPSNPKSKSETKESRKHAQEIEKKFRAQLDATLVFHCDSNITIYDPQYTDLNSSKVSSYNWHEIIKLFEKFLLIESSMYPRFTPTFEAVFINSEAKLLNDETFLGFIKKLFAFYQPIDRPNERSYVNSDVSLELSNRIAYAGCCLMDFVLQSLQDLKLSSSGNGSASLSITEYALIEFIQGLKIYLSAEFLKVSF